VAMLMCVVFGLVALAQLDTDEFPEIDAPVVAVSVIYPGASPDVVEREVVDQIEEAIAGISGVDKMRSSSLDNFGTIIVEFDFSKDPRVATQEIRDKISGIRNELPPEMEEPVLTQFDPADQPIVSLTLSSPGLNSAELTRIADPGITRRLRGINGVATVNLAGAVERELVVELRPRDLQANGIGVGHVVQALQAQNLAVPVGRLEGKLDERTIRLRGRLDRATEFKDIVVSQSGGRIIRLGDVADVKDGTEEPRSFALFNDDEAVGINILKSTGFSTTAVAAEVRRRVEEIQQTLPAGVTLRVVQDSGVRVADSVASVQSALFEGAALTVAVVFLFLNSWRSTVITGLALPVSVLSSFIAVWAFGFTLNTMSLLGLSLAIGILIDDAIVVRENIVRHIEMGKDHVVASHEGTREIALAVAATTFSIVAVFVPIAFMSGIAGQWFKPFALTLACSVLVSLFVSFSLDPMLSAYWPDPQIEAHERRNPIARALDRFNQWFDRQAERYKGVIAWALDHRVAILGIVAAAFFGAIALQATLGGAGFVPQSDRSEITLTLETPPGSNLEYTERKAQQLVSIARSHPEVLYTYTSIGSSDGSGGVDNGSIYMKLKPKADRDIGQSELARRIRAEARRISGVESYISEGGPGGGGKQLQIQVRGDNLDALEEAARLIEVELAKVPGATDVGLSTGEPRPELEIQLNRGLAGSMGLTVGQIAQSLRPAFAGIDAGDWVDPLGLTRDVTVRLAPEARENITDLERLPLLVNAVPATTDQTGAVATGPVTVPLGQVATITRTMGPAEIEHLDRDKVVTVGANVQGRSLNEVFQDANRRIQRLQLPPGVELSQGGEVEEQSKVFQQVFAALGLALMLMYFILVVQFGSFLDPFAILLSLPLSLVGVVLALLITGDTLNIMSLIGVILLMGIVAKNAILLIDFAKWNHEKGMPLREALIEAGRVRLRPIIMTTVALIAGMIPVAMGLGEGADFRAPLGRAVIGGTITSTLLTLLVIPTVYEILVEMREKVRGVFRRRSHVALRPEGEPAGVGRH
ncbi:MAG TPA: efflux RND transporter permease subunit, partial [Thermoanaerobaculia bacterium]